MSVNQGTDVPSSNSVFNVVQMGITMCGLFTAFNTMQGFESSVNKELGLWSLFILYFIFAFGNFLSFVVVQTFGEKLALFFGGLTYVLYLLANIYPRYYTLIPAAALLGFGAAILWTAQGSYLAKNSDPMTLGSNSGIFFACFMMNAVIGNLLAAILLHFGFKLTFIFIIFSIIGGICTTAFLFLRKPKGVISSERAKGVKITEVLLMFREPKMLLMIPVLIYSGISQAFFYSRLPQEISPTSLLAFVMATFGGADALGSLVLGRLGDRMGKKPILILASIVGAIGVAASWEVSGSRTWLFFVIMILLGFSDAGYNTTLYSTIGTFQPLNIEAGYAFLKCIQALSTAIAFFYSIYLTLDQIVIVVEVCLLVSIICYVFCDILVAKVDQKIELVDT